MGVRTVDRSTPSGRRRIFFHHFVGTQLAMTAFSSPALCMLRLCRVVKSGLPGSPPAFSFGFNIIYFFTPCANSSGNKVPRISGCCTYKRLRQYNTLINSSVIGSFNAEAMPVRDSCGSSSPPPGALCYPCLRDHAKTAVTRSVAGTAQATRSRFVPRHAQRGRRAAPRRAIFSQVHARTRIVLHATRTLHAVWVLL